MKIQRNSRLPLVHIGLAIFFLLILLKIIYLQVISYPDFKKKADAQHRYIVELSGARGDIIDARGVRLAANLPSYSLYGLPRKTKAKLALSNKVSSLLDIPQEYVLKKLSQDKSFVWIKRKLNKSQRDIIEEAGLEGVGFLKEPKRFYPQQKLACHILGFVDIDNVGLEGLELFFDDYLSAKRGKAILLRDSKGRILPLYKELVPPRDGFNLVLNVDSHIQYWAEHFLLETVKNTKAKAGQVVVINPQDGRVLALCNEPGFDPNMARDRSSQDYRNRVVADFYEPGSVFKIVTLLAALSEKKELDNSTFYCEKGFYKIPGSILHDWKKFGDLTFLEVFQNSSNIGVAKIANILGREKLYTYINKFKFGKATGIDLPGETSGYVKPTSSWSKTSDFIIPIGQEICTSLLQLATAFSAIANGGYLIKPYIVDKIVDKNGVVIKQIQYQRKEKIFSDQVAKRAKHILWRVVEEGTGRRAKIKGIKIAGKTGTAQKISPKGGYSQSDYFATFLGFFPVDEPEYLIAVVIDEPRTYHYGGMVAAPLFKKIAQKVIEYKNLIQNK